MVSIGDVILRVIADLKGFSTSIQKEAGLAGDKAGATLTSRMSKSVSKGGVGKGIIQGLGLGAGLGVVSLASTVVGKFTDVLTDSINAAKEDQISQQKLGTILQANIPNWDGNTAAIEKTIAASTKYGFSDDDLRDSLGKLTIATHDVNKAFELQATAMDLARLRKISLADATDLLTKVEAGSFRVLKSLGIELKKNATAEDALAAIRQAARNQAADYLKTDAGKEQAAQVKLNESLENLGYKIMPLVTSATVAASDAISGLVDHITEAGGAGDILGDIFGRDASKLEDPITAIGKLDRAVTDFLADFVDFATPWDDYVSATDERKRAINETSDALDRSERSLRGASSGVDELDRSERSINQAAKKVGDDYDLMAREAATATNRIITLNKEQTRSFADMVSDMESEASSLIDQVYDPVIQHNELAANAEEQAALRRIVASKGVTSAQKQHAIEQAKTAKERAAAEKLVTNDEIRDAWRRLAELSKSADETRLALLESGNLSADDTKAWLGRLKHQYDKSTGAAKTRIGELITKINELVGVSAPGVKIGVTASFGAAPITNNKPRARGGPVYAGVPYLVNEDTRNSEIFVPGRSGAIVNQAQAARAAAGMSAPTTGPQINVYGARVDTPERISDVIRRGQFVVSGRPWDPGGEWS